ncbi:MAG TPA: YetF domain-containing protein [Solirubrobacterales bacterium]|nr:YetF domain-containing protein [Solirubrobacterales bacterium]
MLRAAAIYVIVFMFFRLSGKRTMSQLTAFDLVLLLIISEATQQAILGDDFSIVGGALAVVTLIMLERLSDTLSWRSDRFDRLFNDGPVIVVENGRPLRDRMERYRLSDDDVVQEARSTQGIERMDQIKYAVLEQTGSISVVPRSG